MDERKIPTIDVVDLITRLKREFPHVELVVDEEVKKQGIWENTFHVLKLTKLLGHRFEKPIKTSISLKKDSYISENEYQTIKNMMNESFSKYKLLGIV
jgi:D-serine dehydratase